MLSYNYEFLKLELIEPKVLVVKIDRPTALNALNTQVLSELKRMCLNVMENQSAVRVLVVTGGGEKSFVAGADISEMLDKSPAEAIQFSKLGQQVTEMMDALPQPIIAAVNGFALGGGTELALACDFIYASENAWFGQPEVCLGVIPGFGGTVRLSKFVGLPMAKELLMTGKKITATEAKAIGLVNALFPKGQVLEQAIETAKKISLNAFGAVSRCKKLSNEFGEMNGISYKLDAESHDFGTFFGRFDQKEGMKAFSEKRKPEFEGLI